MMSLWGTPRPMLGSQSETTSEDSNKILIQPRMKLHRTRIELPKRESEDIQLSKDNSDFNSDCSSKLDFCSIKNGGSYLKVNRSVASSLKLKSPSLFMIQDKLGFESPSDSSATITTKLASSSSSLGYNSLCIQNNSSLLTCVSDASDHASFHTGKSSPKEERKRLVGGLGPSDRESVRVHPVNDFMQTGGRIDNLTDDPSAPSRNTIFKLNNIFNKIYICSDCLGYEWSRLALYSSLNHICSACFQLKNQLCSLKLLLNSYENSASGQILVDMKQDFNDLLLNGVVKNSKHCCENGRINTLTEEIERLNSSVTVGGDSPVVETEEVKQALNPSEKQERKHHANDRANSNDKTEKPDLKPTKSERFESGADCRDPLANLSHSESSASDIACFVQSDNLTPSMGNTAAVEDKSLNQKDIIEKFLTLAQGLSPSSGFHLETTAAVDKSDVSSCNSLRNPPDGRNPTAPSGTELDKPDKCKNVVFGRKKRKMALKQLDHQSVGFFLKELENIRVRQEETPRKNGGGNDIVTNLTYRKNLDTEKWSPATNQRIGNGYEASNKFDGLTALTDKRQTRKIFRLTSENFCSRISLMSSTISATELPWGLNLSTGRTVSNRTKPGKERRVKRSSKERKGNKTRRRKERKSQTTLQRQDSKACASLLQWKSSRKSKPKNYLPKGCNSNLDYLLFTDNWLRRCREKPPRANHKSDKKHPKPNYFGHRARNVHRNSDETQFQSDNINTSTKVFDTNANSFPFNILGSDTHRNKRKPVPFHKKIDPENRSCDSQKTTYGKFSFQEKNSIPLNFSSTMKSEATSEEKSHFNFFDVIDHLNSDKKLRREDRSQHRSRGHKQISKSEKVESAPAKLSTISGVIPPRLLFHLTHQPKS